MVKFKPRIEELLAGEISAKKKISPTPQKVEAMVQIMNELNQREDLKKYLFETKQSIYIHAGDTNDTSVGISGEGLYWEERETGSGERVITESIIPEYARFLIKRGYTPKTVVQEVEKGLEKKVGM